MKILRPQQYDRKYSIQKRNNGHIETIETKYLPVLDSRNQPKYGAGYQQRYNNDWGS